MLSAKSMLLYLLAAGITNCQCPDVSSIIAHDGTPVGSEEIIDGGEETGSLFMSEHYSHIRDQ